MLIEDGLSTLDIAARSGWSERRVIQALIGHGLMGIGDQFMIPLDKTMLLTVLSSHGPDGLAELLGITNDELNSYVNGGVRSA